MCRSTAAGRRNCLYLYASRRCCTGGGPGATGADGEGESLLRNGGRCTMAIQRGESSELIRRPSHIARLGRRRRRLISGGRGGLGGRGPPRPVVCRLGGARAGGVLEDHHRGVAAAEADVEHGRERLRTASWQCTSRPNPRYPTRAQYHRLSKSRHTCPSMSAATACSPWPDSRQSSTKNHFPHTWPH